MKIDLLEQERIDDLLTNDLKIIQSADVFSFSMDAVLLARFAGVPKYGSILDLCTGNGVIPLLLSQRTQGDIWGVEIQERLADMAVRNVRLNGLEHRLHMRQGDLRTIHQELGHGTFDVVTVNPPYMPLRAGEQNGNSHIAAARHEIYCTLDDVAAACSRLVKFGGKVAMVHRPSRLAEILEALRRHRLEPKRIRFVHPRAEEESNMVLIEAIRDGKPDVKLLPPLIVYEQPGQYCRELLEIYYGGTEPPAAEQEG
ncbi:methyltransferase [Paenibacillus sp. J31TS4]|uniref:tRNA1(Val) (adenine(37)-N6)-methyltransferase n=1 Tax=Paenibacillus sp. J31TS4 TaxID=2807195 RepID=UPI001B12B20E|nr:tRNA1(Val) (adenine(37)-N6)-methyltransferase [Paenibacillus sp. J31TS4]GIP41377.1 methyltransferase [Paenibacillus sp. J31TS4]